MSKASSSENGDYEDESRDTMERESIKLRITKASSQMEDNVQPIINKKTLFRLESTSHSIPGRRPSERGSPGHGSPGKGGLYWQKPKEIPQDLSKTLPDGQIKKNYGKITRLYGRLDGLVNVMDNKMEGVVEKQQKEFLLAYKGNVDILKGDLETYKKKLNAIDVDMQKDKFINELKENINYYREESCTLANICTKQKIRINTLRSNLDESHQEKSFLEKQVKESKKQNKILKIALAKSENECEQIVNLSSTIGTTLPITTLERTLESVGMVGEEIKIESTLSPIREDIMKDYSGGSISRPNLAAAKTISQKTRRAQELLNLNYGLKLHNFIQILESLNLPQIQIYNEIEKYLEIHNEKLEEVIQSVRNQLKIEREKVLNLKKRENENGQEKREMEELFYDCVEEVKRDILNRKQTLNYMATNKLNIKKEMINIGTTDKKRILELLLSNEKLIGALYDLIFKLNAGGDTTVLVNKELGLEELKGRPTYKTPLMILQGGDRDTRKDINDINEILEMNRYKEYVMNIEAPSAHIPEELPNILKKGMESRSTKPETTKSPLELGEYAYSTRARAGHLEGPPGEYMERKYRNEGRTMSHGGSIGGHRDRGRFPNSLPGANKKFKVQGGKLVFARKTRELLGERNKSFDFHLHHK